MVETNLMHRIFNVIKRLCLVSLALMALTSCEDTDTSRVEISVVPDVPAVGNFEFDTSDETVSPNWFAFAMSFRNPTSKRLIIRTVTVSYRIGNQREFGGNTELDAHPEQAADFFLDVDSQTEGLEFVHLPTVGTAFTRYLYDLNPDPVAPRNFNYYLKFVFSGFFTEDDTSNFPLPSEGFEKTIYIRTKSSLDL